MGQKEKEAAKKAWETRRKRKKPIKIEYQPPAKPKAQAVKNGTKAAKKAWVTRRKNEEEAEKERQEALAILDALAAQR